MGTLTEYPTAFASVKAGSVAFVDFELAGTALAAMDSPVPNPVAFSEGVSLIVNCEAQIDRYWNALSAVPEAEQCGWLKDRYGVSWQVVPESLGIGFNDDDPRPTTTTSRFLWAWARSICRSSDSDRDALRRPTCPLNWIGQCSWIGLCGRLTWSRQSAPDSRRRHAGKFVTGETRGCKELAGRRGRVPSHP